MAFLHSAAFSHLNRIPEGKLPLEICVAIRCKSFSELPRFVLPKLLGLNVLFRTVCLIVFVMLPPPLLVRYPPKMTVALLVGRLPSRFLPFHLS